MLVKLPFYAVPSVQKGHFIRDPFEAGIVAERSRASTFVVVSSKPFGVDGPGFESRLGGMAN